MQTAMFQTGEPIQNSEPLTRIVLEWQDPLYNFALRMLGNEADAADATQEIFVAIVRNFHRYDSHRPLKPWIYRVATRLLYNIIRDSKLRKRRESEVPMKRDESPVGRRLERQELENLVSAQVAKLSDEARSLILLHYYQGLSEEEVAESLAISRTTAQGRIHKALRLLKRGLATSGLVAIVPTVDAIMRSSASIHVPAKLASSLMSIAATGSSVTTVTTGLTLGGVLMTKQIIGGALIIGLLSLVAGMWAGRTILRADGERPAAGKAASGADASLVSRAEFEKLKAEHARTVEELRKKEAEALLLADRARVGSRPEPAPVDGVEGRAKNGADAGIDWSKFAEMLASNLDLVALASTVGHKLTPEQQAKMAEIHAEYMKLVAKAKTASPTPFFDPKILPDYVQALFGKSLGLSTNQLAELDKATRSFLDGQLGQLDPRTALPVELYQARVRMISDITGSVSAMLDESQRARWDATQSVSERLMRGDESIGHIGLVEGGDSTKYVDNVYRQWDWAYSIDEKQQGAVRSVAATYVSEAERLLRTYGQFGANARPLSAADQSRLTGDFFMLQARMEREFQQFLTEEQRDAMRRRPPAIIRFHYGSDSNTSRNFGNSF